MCYSLVPSVVMLRGDMEAGRTWLGLGQGSQVTKDTAEARSSNCPLGTLGLTTVVRKEQDDPSLLP